jgi:DNA-binding beta-propeller fold protein YncE
MSIWSRRITGPLAAAAAVALVGGWLAAGAAPATAVQTFGLLTGPGGCLTGPRGSSDASGDNCVKASALGNPAGLALSADGRQLYVADSSGSAALSAYGGLVVLQRDAATGGLTESGCLSNDTTDGRDGASGKCTLAPGLRGAGAVAVSADGSTVYAASAAAGAASAFGRDATTGALSEIGCLQSVPPGGGGCRGARVFPGSNSLAVAPDNAAVYVGSAQDSVIAALTAGLMSASAASGSAATLFGAVPFGSDLGNPCIAAGGIDGACTVGVAEQGATSIALSPDGRELYAAAPGSGALDVFARAADGSLTQSGCVMHSAPPGLCAASRFVSAPVALAVSPDGKNVYAIENADTGQVDVLTRDAATGALTEASCLQDNPPPDTSDNSASGAQSDSGCTPVTGLPDPQALVVSPDGSSVSVVSYDGTLTTFARDAASGALTEAACLSPDDSRCGSTRSLEGASDLAESPDGRNLYISDASGQVLVLGPATAVASSHALVRGRRATVTLACPRAMLTPCRGRLDLRELTRAGTRGGRAGHAASTAGYRIAPGRSASVAVSVASRVASAVHRGRHVHLVVSVLPAPGGGGASRTVLAALRG